MRMIEIRSSDVRMAIVIMGALAIGLAAQMAVGFGAGDLCELHHHVCAGPTAW